MYVCMYVSQDLFLFLFKKYMCVFLDMYAACAACGACVCLWHENKKF